MRPLRLAPRTLAAKFHLIVVFGALLPLALVGLWLTHSAERSGVALLREQLNGEADLLLRTTGERWRLLQADLMLLANNTSARTLVTLPAGVSLEGRDSTYLHQLEQAFDASITSFSYQDAAGQVRWSFSTAITGNTSPRSGSGLPPGVRAASAVVPIGLPIRTEDGRVIGRLAATIRLASVLPDDAQLGLLPGATLSVATAAGSIWSSAPLAVDVLAPEVPQGWEIATRELVDSPLRFVLAAPTAPYVTPFRHAAEVGLVLLLSVTFVALMVSMAFARRVTHALEHLAEAAGAVAAGDLQRTVSESGNDEVGRVGASFNAMTESLRRTLGELAQQRALAAVGEFAASLSHDVRNALTAIRVDLQHAIWHLPSENPGTALASRTLDTVRRLDATVTGALRVARSGQSRVSTVDLHAVLRQAMDDAEPSFVERGAILKRSGEQSPLDLEADGPALVQLFLNLLLNSAQALAAGGSARVEVETTDGMVTVKVVDTGTGIAPEDLDRIGTFARTTKSHGTGLGLPIARRIAMAHGGDLQVSSVLGQGTTVAVRLPLGRSLPVGDGHHAPAG